MVARVARATPTGSQTRQERHHECTTVASVSLTDDELVLVVGGDDADIKGDITVRPN